jgi:hypothetical protein
MIKSTYHRYFLIPPFSFFPQSVGIINLILMLNWATVSSWHINGTTWEHLQAHLPKDIRVHSDATGKVSRDDIRLLLWKYSNVISWCIGSRRRDIWDFKLWCRMLMWELYVNKCFCFESKKKSGARMKLISSSKIQVLSRLVLENLMMEG